MRLGDLDALENAIDKERQILIEQGRPGAEHIVVHHARRLIEDAPTIDAIPVEWLEKRRDNQGDPWDYLANAIDYIIATYKKEQEAR